MRCVCVCVCVCGVCVLVLVLCAGVCVLACVSDETAELETTSEAGCKADGMVCVVCVAACGDALSLAPVGGVAVTGEYRGVLPLALVASLSLSLSVCFLSVSAPELCCCLSSSVCFSSRPMKSASFFTGSDSHFRCVCRAQNQSAAPPSARSRPPPMPKAVENISIDVHAPVQDLHHEHDHESQPNPDALSVSTPLHATTRPLRGRGTKSGDLSPTTPRDGKPDMKRARTRLYERGQTAKGVIPIGPLITMLSNRDLVSKNLTDEDRQKYNRCVCLLICVRWCRALGASKQAMRKFHCAPWQQAVHDLKSNHKTGLSSEEAKLRLAQVCFTHSSLLIVDCCCSLDWPQPAGQTAASSVLEIVTAAVSGHPWCVFPSFPNSHVARFSFAVILLIIATGIEMGLQQYPAASVILLIIILNATLGVVQVCLAFLCLLCLCVFIRVLCCVVVMLGNSRW